MSGHGTPPRVPGMWTPAPQSPVLQPELGVPDGQPNAVWAGDWLTPLFLTPADPSWTTNGYNTFGASTGVFRRGVWQSALFDLRPELKGSLGSFPIAKPITDGMSRTLIVSIRVPTGAANVDFEVYAFEYGSPTDPGKTGEMMRQLNLRQAMTEDVYDQSTTTNYAMLPFSPSGVRFWRVAIVFDQMVDVVGPSVTMRGAMY